MTNDQFEVLTNLLQSTKTELQEQMQSTKTELQGQLGKHETQFEVLANLIKTAHDDLSERLDGHDEQFEKMDQRFANLEAHVAQLSTDVKGNTQAIGQLRDEVQNLNGLPKEIDYAFVRIGALEKHAGIQPPVVAEFA